MMLFSTLRAGFDTALHETNARIARCASSWAFLHVVVPLLSCLPVSFILFAVAKTI